MDRSWINSKRFDKPHRDGVSEFMKLVSENFGADEQILCPCRKCLNRISEHKGKVEDHLYIYGMASMYTRWIYHGEPMQDTIIENTGHQDEQIHFTADVNLNEVEEADPDDRIPDMVQELFTSEEGPRKKSMFAILLEELKQELYPGAAYSRFSFVVKLLHIKSFYRISNVAFTAFVKLLADAFPHCSIPASYEEAKKLIRALGLGYNTIHVPPMQAAKLASEGGIILRQHVPIFTHWKEYKDDKNKDILPSYMGKIANQLAIDTDSEPVKEACADLLRSGTRQMRYNLKKLYFNGVPAYKVRTTSPLKSMTDDQWRELVEMWSSPKHKDKCAKNALNREKVRFHQMTGSRCYIATTHALKQEKYKDEPPSAIDLFKALHCSSKTGFNESAKEAIAEMESIAAAPVEEGQVSKTPAEVVAQVLPKSKFLQNIGLKLAAPKRSSKAVNDARVIELEAEVVAGKQDKEELKDEMETLKKKVEESENERRRLLEETEQLKKAQDELKKAQDETNAFFRRMFNKE